MFAKVTSSVLILKLLLCSIFGCCWHHAHAFEPSDCCQEGVYQTAVLDHSDAEDTCCHGHVPARSVGEKPSVPETPCPAPEPCDENRCLFVKGFSSADRAENPCKSTAVLAVAFSPVFNFESPDPLVDRRCSHVALRCHSPVERCALLQSWRV